MAKQNALTDTKIKAAKPQPKESTLIDGKGLYLLVMPNGSKIWRFRYYRPLTKKRNLLSFGKYPETTLQQARKQRDEARELIANGIDPQTHKAEMLEREKQEQKNTFLSVAQSWFELEKGKPNLKTSTAIAKWRKIEIDVLPVIGNYPINQIIPRRIIPILESVRARGTGETANRLAMIVNQILDFAVFIGLLELNPCQNVVKAILPPTKQNHPCVKIDELPAFLKAFNNQNMGIMTRLLFKWQMLTATRANEATGALFDEIDESAQIWTIPAERMKSKREHIIPLSNQVMRIYEELKTARMNSNYLFHSVRSKEKHLNNETINRTIHKMGYAGKMVSHSFRSLASTVLNSYQGKNLERFDHDVIEAALAHQDKNQVRRAYNRADYLEQKKQVFQFWADFIDRAEQGNINLIEN